MITLWNVATYQGLIDGCVSLTLRLSHPSLAGVGAELGNISAATDQILMKLFGPKIFLDPNSYLLKIAKLSPSPNSS